MRRHEGVRSFATECRSMCRSMTSRALMAAAFLAVALPPLVAEAAEFSFDFVGSAPQTYDHAVGGGAYDDRTVGVADDIVEPVVDGNEERFVRRLAWMSFTSARHYIRSVVEKAGVGTTACAGAA